MPRAQGFSLVELITVLVLIAILSVVGGQFIVTALDSYRASNQRAELVQRSRQAVEQVARQLRLALPYSVRISGSGRCLEFLPVLGAGYYLNPVPDLDNGAAGATSIATAPFSLSQGTAGGQYVAIGGQSPTELYGASPASLGTLSGPVGPSGINSLSLAAATVFARNSINQRLYVVTSPVRFCALADELREYRGYGLPASVTDTPPNTGTLLADGVVLSGETPFALSTAVEARNTIVQMQLPFTTADGERIVLNHQVMIRNVP